MKLAEKMDSGPVYLQKEVTLAPDETTSSAGEAHAYRRAAAAGNN